MIRNLLLHLLSAVSIVFFLTACDNETNQDSLSPGQVNARYSNKLSSQENLTLGYEGMPLIGKDVYFELKSTNTAEVTLFNVLPGETQTSIKEVAITAGADGYTFTGNATGTNGTTFNYNGHVIAGKMELDVMNIKIPASSLTEHGTWHIVHTGKGANTLYNGIGGEGSLIGTIYSLVGHKLLSNLVSSVLDNVTFMPDGNLTAAYAPLPDSVKIGQMITGNGLVRPSGDWKTSPVNLAFYYVKNNSDLYIVPNIDMIIRQVQLNKGTKADSDNLMNVIKQVYGKIVTWGTIGVKLTIRTEGDQKLLVLEKEEIQDLFALLPLIKGLLPAETLDKPLTEVLAGVIPEQYLPLINLLLPGATLGSTLDLLTQELYTIPIELGLYLDK